MWHCFCDTRRLFLLHSSTSSDEAFLPDVTPLGLSTTPGIFVLSKYSQDWMKLRTHFTWAKEPQPSHRGQTIDDRGSVCTEYCTVFLSECLSSPDHKGRMSSERQGDSPLKYSCLSGHFEAQGRFLALHVHPWVERGEGEGEKCEKKNCKGMRIRTKGIFCSGVGFPP